MLSFNGYSIGKWVDSDGDGRYDLLEVESRGFKGPRTFDGSGLPLHQDGESVITERISLDKADTTCCTTRSRSSITRSLGRGR